MIRCWEDRLKRQGWLLLCLAIAHAHVGWGAPAIVLTNVPLFGSFDDLSGIVVDAAPAAHRVAVFIYVPSAGWWSKPYCDLPLTAIRPDGSWTADITTGGVDEFATKITALLVSTDYNEPCVKGPATLPTNVTAQAIASAAVERADPNLRWISFSGYDWWVKSSPGLVGPGPNYFSDRADDVWVDAQGRLHLKIVYRNGRWYSTEVFGADPLGYGTYTFTLASRVDQLDKNIVLGLFTWDDTDPAYYHREIDIEFSRWGEVRAGRRV